MSDAYSSVVGGKLNLKGAISKKKKKKHAVDDDAAAAAVAAAATSAAARPPDGAASSSSSFMQAAAQAGHTEAELRRLETKAKRNISKLEKGDVKSHRERVQEFNTYLGNLTEHYDLPKVSKGN